ncbi:MAG: homocysteine S-methyltransferase family protein [Bacillota bacterium]|jgi:5-methyltetrahydrofolate--homocysteine methyltransferase
MKNDLERELMDLLSLIQQQKPVLFDGGMGTQLARLGLELNGGVNNLSHPEKVLAVHKSYVESGAQVIATNTFTMNPIYIKTHNVDIDMEKANHAGVQIAKKSGAGFVLGDMGPTGQLLQPFGPYTEQEIIACYQAQGRVLAQAGVDGFIIETMIDLKEALCALRGCREVSSLPVVVSFTLSGKSSGGRTLMGQTMAQCAAAVAEQGGNAIGINCGELDPEEIAQVVAELRHKTDLPILTQPNAGKPKLVQGETVYDMSPDIFAQGILKCLEAGATMVGGCCGTTPDHIKAVAELISKENKKQ